MDIHQIAQKFYAYSSAIKGYTPATIKRYRYVLTSYCRYAGLTTITDITDENLRNLFYYGRTQRAWTSNTFIVFYKSLSIFFKWCVAEKYLDRNFITGIEKPKLEKRLPVKLTKQNALILLEIVYNYPYSHSFLRYRNHAIFATFMFAGLRLNELLKLRYADVDLENLTLFINQGKGSKDRIVPIGETLAQSLKRYLTERRKLNKACPEFFVSLHLNCRFTESGMKNLVVQMRKASGLKFSVHKLRHTFATLMLEGGCDIYSLSQMMGHSDIKTTTIYLSASAEHLRAQMTKHPLNIN